MITGLYQKSGMPGMPSSSAEPDDMAMQAIQKKSFSELAKMPDASKTALPGVDNADDLSTFWTSFKQQRETITGDLRKGMGRERSRMAAAGMDPNSEAWRNALDAVKAGNDKLMRELMSRPELGRLRTELYDKYNPDGDVDEFEWYDKYFADSESFRTQLEADWRKKQEYKQAESSMREMERRLDQGLQMSEAQRRTKVHGRARQERETANPGRYSKQDYSAGAKAYDAMLKQYQDFAKQAGMKAKKYKSGADMRAEMKQSAPRGSAGSRRGLLLGGY